MRTPVLLSLLVALAACSNTTSLASSRNAYEAQPCTNGVCSRSASPSTASEGMALGNVKGYRETVCTPMARLLSDAGTFPVATLVDAGVVHTYLWDPDLDGTGDGGWGWNSSLDWTPDNGSQCSSRDFLAPAPMNGWRLAVVASSVVVSIADAGVASIFVNVDACLNGNGC